MSTGNATSKSGRTFSVGSKRCGEGFEEAGAGGSVSAAGADALAGGVPDGAGVLASQRVEELKADVARLRDEYQKLWNRTGGADPTRT